MKHCSRMKIEYKDEKEAEIREGFGCEAEAGVSLGECKAIEDIV